MGLLSNKNMNMTRSNENKNNLYFIEHNLQNRLHIQAIMRGFNTLLFYLSLVTQRDICQISF